MEGKMALRLRLACKVPRYGLGALHKEGQELCVHCDEVAQGASRKTECSVWDLRRHLGGGRERGTTQEHGK